MEIDKKFNRVKTKTENFYISTYGKNADVSNLYQGKVKCKLLHSKDDSIVFPDQIFIAEKGTSFKWIQPLTFLVNLLVKDEEIIHCGFFVDISAGNTLNVEFTNNDFVKNLPDNSAIYNCKIFGPKNITDYATGEGEVIDGIPHLYLYHHTLPRYKELILKSSELKLSKWNIQGTKKLSNIGYFYLTALNRIQVNNDLEQIAMSSRGAIYLLLDNYEYPKKITFNKAENIKNGVLELKVYRENTLNRKASIKFLVDSSVIAPKHLWKHAPNNQPVFYEICMPFIYRIGGESELTLGFKKDVISNQKNIKMLDYQVVGLGNSFSGLEAPYDEENTEHIFKIEKLNTDTNILEFWFENSNTDQFSEKIIDIQKFEKTPPDNV
ncbi:hypothetical protein [Prolixibacter sp. NT017]|uniref:hypothetical protein n=1 Tax=Prolixibacter sp. NT017 TaxID=2652390 RepID=UPI0012822937|nr:hypothetical protein [Prolixibacter sp. NT017]GET25993.1 hypothetical protein NT017_23220 [Prolixibacter sp. NT017]